MKTSLLAVTAMVASGLAGCGLIPKLAGFPEDLAGQENQARLIEIEVDDLESGLPCSVVDRPDANDRKVLWHARYEEGFCRRKAKESRLTLERRGWACRPENADERRDRVKAREAGPSDGRHIVAAWRCVAGLAPIERPGRDSPPVPSARPDRPEVRPANWGVEPLRAAVERDLATIGQNMIGDDTTVDAALGDLDEDGSDDAVVVLTRISDLGAPHRLLMAYLNSGELFNLVDVWVMQPPGPDDGELELAIENGRIILENCCEDRGGSVTMALEDRKLAFAGDARR